MRQDHTTAPRRSAAAVAHRQACNDLAAALAAVAVVALVLLGGLPVVLLERYGGRG